MKILVVADGQYFIDRENDVYVESVFDYSFYSRYLSAFEDVYAIVRAEKVDYPPQGSKKASGANVHFLCLPPSKGVKQFLFNYCENRRLIKRYLQEFECAIFRVPGVVSNMVMSIFGGMGKSYAIEVVVDPWEYFAKGTIQGITRPFVRRKWTRDLRRACKKARGVSYVTEKYLQQKYPCQAILSPESGYFTSYYSSVELPDDRFGSAKTYCKKDEYVISHVANSFSSYGKGHVVLMKAVKKVVDKGYKIDVWFVGDGPLRKEFENIANELGIIERVSFLGRLPSGEQVREKIRESDLFVFPTRAEGLPRVVLEAMSEGVPVISSPVCGIPEILTNDCLVDCNDPDGYAEAIIHMIENPDFMTECSERNLQKAKEYGSSVLNVRRKAFYMKVRKIIEGTSAT